MNLQSLKQQLEEIDNNELALPSLYKLNNDDDLVPCDEEVKFEIKDQIKQARQDVIEEIIDAFNHDYRFEGNDENWAIRVKRKDILQLLSNIKQEE